MPIISFKKQFADSVKYGIKEQTIRKNGKDIQELIFAILDSEIKGMRDLSCTSINYVFKENENYLKYQNMLNEGFRKNI